MSLRAIAWQSRSYTEPTLLGVYPLLAAGGPVTFVATKVTKKAVSREASLPHKAFALQTRQNQGCNYFAPLRSHNPTLQQKLAMPLQTHRPTLFCPLSPEAYLLTRKELHSNYFVMLNGVKHLLCDMPFYK